jgi:hypothetical protein
VLDLTAVDLEQLAYALEDHSDLTQWWLDPSTGQVEPWSLDRLGDEEEDEDHPEDRGLRLVEPIMSSESYRDLEDFVERVRDPRGRDLLERAIAGRGAFRRFKDTLFDFPDLREAWFRFHDARMERRALEWLADEGLVDSQVVERAIADRQDPDAPEIAGPFDPLEVARAVVADLRRLYGARLKRVLLFGSWARGDAHAESDIDLLVVIDGLESAWHELRAMDDVLWRHSLANDTVVTALPVGQGELERGRRPVLIRAQAEGLDLA